MVFASARIGRADQGKAPEKGRTYSGAPLLLMSGRIYMIT